MRTSHKLAHYRWRSLFKWPTRVWLWRGAHETCLLDVIPSFWLGGAVPHGFGVARSLRPLAACSPARFGSSTLVASCREATRMWLEFIKPGALLSVCLHPPARARSLVLGL